MVDGHLLCKFYAGLIQGRLRFLRSSRSELPGINTEYQRYYSSGFLTLQREVEKYVIGMVSDARSTGGANLRFYSMAHEVFKRAVFQLEALIRTAIASARDTRFHKFKCALDVELPLKFCTCMMITSKEDHFVSSNVRVLVIRRTD